MTLPRPHSCTWSDGEQRKGLQPSAGEVEREGPGSLKDKELHLWVTYPEPKGRKTRKSKKAGSGRKDLKLWAVLIIEDLRRLDAFTYQVTLRRIFKRDERWIKVWVNNDPHDQSDDAGVFGFVSPHPRQLTALEQYLVHVAARRVYDAIAETWSGSETRASLGTA